MSDLPGRPAFGALLRELRIAAELSQEALAERARISSQAVGALERGVRHAPRRQTFDLLCDALSLKAGSSQRAAFESAALASTKARIRTAPAAERTTALPRVPTSFVGRERERGDVAALLTPGRCTTVWGTGGIGKTRLALETANDVAGRYPDGVWFVELAPLRTDADVAAAVATATGVRDGDERGIDESLVRALATKRGLIVLDNAEHVLAGSAFLVERLLRDAPSMTMACTSREPLRIGGERVYALDPLPIPAVVGSQLESEPAIRLFLDRAASAGAPLDVDAATLRTIALICRRLDAIPLAIELAAARTRVMSVADIATGLDDRFRLLSRGSRTADDRQKTLHGVLDWSFNLVSPDERAVLRRMAVWPGTWSIEDAVAIAGADLARWDVIDAVGLLVDRSLVTVTATPPGAERRYRLLQTTAAYAHERLVEAGEEDRIARRAAERMGALLRAANESWRGGGDEKAFRLIEIASLRAALRWTISLGSDLDLGTRIAGDAAKIWDMRSLHFEGLRWIDAALAAQPADARSGARVTAYLGRARLYRWLIRHQPTYDAALAAMHLADEAGDAGAGAIARMQLVGAAYALGREDEGRRALDDGTALFEKIGDSRGRDSALWERAVVAFRAGDHTTARDALLDLAERSRAIGATRQVMQATIGAAEAEFALGDVRAAIEHGRAALEVARSVDDTLQTGTALQNLAAYHLELGALADATALARESLDLFSANGFDVPGCFSIGHLADVLARSGRERDAAVLIGYADDRLASAGTVRDPTEKRVYERSLGACARALGPEELERRKRDGAAMDDDEAVDLALDLTHDLGETSA